MSILDSLINCEYLLSIHICVVVVDKKPLINYDEEINGFILGLTCHTLCFLNQLLLIVLETQSGRLY